MDLIEPVIGRNLKTSHKFLTEIDKLIQANGTIGDWLLGGLLDAQALEALATA
jgi:hypothetical protein